MLQRCDVKTGLLLASFAVLLSVVLALSACGSGTASTSSDSSSTPSPAMTGDNFSSPAPAESTATAEAGQEVRVEASGFSKKGEELGYGVVLANTSSTSDALELTVTVNALDSKGNVILSDTPALTGIPAGDKFYLGGEMYLNKSDKPKKLEVYADAGSWESVNLGLPKVSNVTVFNEDYWGPKVRGQITNTLDEELSSMATIGIVLFDSKDRVVGGGFAFLDGDLPSGRRAAFEAVNGVNATPYSKIHQAAVSVENAVMQ